MNNKKWILLSLFLFVPSGFKADEILLKEGKVLSGKITNETQDEYTISLGKNMVLRVEKDKVGKVTRDQPSPGPAQKINTPTPKKVDVPSIEVQNPSLTPLRNSYEKQNFSVKEVIWIDPHWIGPTQFGDIDTLVDQEWPDKARVPHWDVSWDGQMQTEDKMFRWKAGVVTATMTFQAPLLKDNDAMKDPERVAWNEYVKKWESFHLGQKKVFTQSLEGFCVSLSKLRAENLDKLQKQSQQLFEEMKLQTTLKQKGYLRRARSKPVLVK